LKLMSTGNEELDVKLQGGLPFPNLMLIEGPHGSSKTVVAQQFLYGALKSGLRAMVFTTETTSSDYFRKMRTLNYDVRDYLIRDKLRIYSLQISEEGWGGILERLILKKVSSFIEKNKNNFNFVLIDSLTHIVSPLGEEDVLGFFSHARMLASEEMMLVFTVHPGAMEEKIATRGKALFDSYIRLSVATLGGRSVKVMEIVKLKGAPSTFDATITFDVDPAFGLKLIPIALARS